MEQNFFRDQMRRLVETYGERNYPTERVELIWKAFHMLPSSAFEAVVTECIANHRSAPMVNDLNKAANELRVREAQNRTQNSGNPFTLVLGEAAGKSANTEYSGFCMQIINKKLDGKMDNQQWDDATTYLQNWADSVDKSRKMPEPKPRKDLE